jgi:hypothetical protein
MQILGSAPQCVFNRIYPFEVRTLTFMAKVGVLWERFDCWSSSTGPPPYYSFSESVLGPPPWSHLPGTCDDASGLPVAQDMILKLWEAASGAYLSSNPGALAYAEKVAPWVPPLMRDVLRSYTVYLFRDPRDVFLSANAFMRKRNYLSFRRQPGDSDLEHAISLSRALLSAFENYRVSKRRSDCCSIRYEDLVSDPERATRHLREATGVEPQDFFPREHRESHGTSETLEASLGRWRREPLAAPVRACLERLLRPILQEFAYDQGDGHDDEDKFYLEFGAHARPASALQCSLPRALGESSILGAHLGTAGEPLQVILPLEPFAAERVREVWVCLAGGAGQSMLISWRRTGQPFAEDSCACIPYHPSRHYQVMRFDLRGHKAWEGSIQELRLGLFGGAHAGFRMDHGYLRWVRLVGP